MGAELDIDDVVAGNPKAEAELQDLRDQNAALRAALYDEQNGVTAFLRQETEQRLRDALEAAEQALRYLGGTLHADRCRDALTHNVR